MIITLTIRPRHQLVFYVGEIRIQVSYWITKNLVANYLIRTMSLTLKGKYWLPIDFDRTLFFDHLIVGEGDLNTRCLI
jgi:hypothetical protein